VRLEKSHLLSHYYPYTKTRQVPYAANLGVAQCVGNLRWWEASHIAAGRERLSSDTKNKRIGK